MNRLFRSLLAGGLFGAAAGTFMMIKRRRQAQMRMQNRFGIRQIMNVLAGRLGGFYRALPLGTWMRRNWLR